MKETGLSTTEATNKLKQFGKNRLLASRTSAWKAFGRQFNSPLIWLLIVAALISFFLSSVADASIIMVIVVVNAGLGFSQEYRSEKLVEKLNALVKRTALVRREGKQIKIAEEEIVPEDIVILENGDVIPADGIIVAAEAPIINESVISGESIPLDRKVGDKLFAGTSLANGYCEIKVTATGMASELGKIAALTNRARKTSKYEQNIARVSQTLIQVTVAITIIVFLVNVSIKGLAEANLVEIMLFTLALAISVVPEALPVIATTTLSMGAFRMSKKHVVVKRLSAVEDLGNIEVLCTDKTGTITANELTVKETIAYDPEKLNSYARFCLEEDSPLDEAIVKALQTQPNADKTHGLKLVARFPFDPALRRRWALVQGKNSRYLVVLGSAIEVLKISKNETAKMTGQVKAAEMTGLRVLGVGLKKVGLGFSFENKFNDDGLEFVGYFNILDPIKSTAAEAIALAQKLKVEIKIITGDSLEVTKYIAGSIGLLKENDKCFLGSDLTKLSAKEFLEACLEGRVFARITPEQKFQIVEALKKRLVVGYQGDGINDAPALKAANVGIAVNHAASIAQEAADIILLKSDLKVVVEGIESGRKIFCNINKYIKHTMVSNWGNLFALAIVSFFTNFLPLLPIQILLTSVFSDLPLLAISTDNVDESDLRRPSKYNPIELISLPLLLGATTAVINLGFFYVIRNQPLDLLRTWWFVFINLTSLVVVFSVRKEGWLTKGKLPSRILTMAIGFTMILSLILPNSFLANVFHFEPISPISIIFVAIVAAIYLVVLDFAKVTYFRLITKEGRAGLL
jgi:P-type Mg2+ transporter